MVESDGLRFDPEQNPASLRLWDNVEGDLVERDPTDPEAFRCDAFGAYWVLVADAALGSMLRLARDPAGSVLWPTPEEAERAARTAGEFERDAARARIAELEAELRRRG